MIKFYIKRHKFDADEDQGLLIMHIVTMCGVALVSSSLPLVGGYSLYIFQNIDDPEIVSNKPSLRIIIYVQS
jgi:hypothetical protein